MNTRYVSVAAIGLVVFGLSACGQPPAEPDVNPNQQAATFDERSKTFGDYEVFFNALSTEQLTPEVARAYNITRSKSRAMLNVTIRKKTPDGGTTAVTGAVTVKATNLTGQLKSLSLRQITEGDAIYYIGDLPVANREVLVFDIKVTPMGETTPYEIRFQQQFYTD